MAAWMWSDPPSLPSARRYGSRSPQELGIQVLGAFHVQIGSWLIPDSAWRVKTARLVELLALAPGHRLHREQVLERLWPGFASDSATNNLHRTLHATRHVLEPHLAPGCPSAYLHLHGDCLALTADGALWVDVEAFEAAGGIARDAQDRAAYRAAVELYTGDLLPENRYEYWVISRREELRGLYLALLLELAQLYEAHGEDGLASRTLERLVATEPTHEEAHLGLMRLYAFAGRRHEALRQYQRLRRALRHELGTEPAEATGRLHQDILDGRFPAKRVPTSRAVRAGSPMPNGSPVASPSSRHGPLTSRECEIAALLACGLTNRQIADTLVITGRTADTHLCNILRKLGMASRAQVAAWAVERGLVALRTHGANGPTPKDTYTYTTRPVSVNCAR